MATTHQHNHYTVYSYSTSKTGNPKSEARIKVEHERNYFIIEKQRIQIAIEQAVADLKSWYLTQKIPRDDPGYTFEPSKALAALFDLWDTERAYDIKIQTCDAWIIDDDQGMSHVPAKLPSPLRQHPPTEVSSPITCNKKSKRGMSFIYCACGVEISNTEFTQHGQCQTCYMSRTNNYTSAQVGKGYACTKCKAKTAWVGIGLCEECISPQLASL
jgi:hypothetical protein